MSSAADAITDFVAPILGDGWRMQFGQWIDDGTDKRYAVLKPAGGLPAGLVRQPQFTLSLISAENEERQVPYDAANRIVEAMRTSSGALVYMESGEPVPMPTNDGRAVFELAISTITN